MPGPHLVYFADPMCSWCWGFSPTIEALRTRFGPALPVRLILGGLRPGTVEPLTGAAKAGIREHWEHVHEASGQPFDWRFFDREAFVYDTEPASRAVVVARRIGMDAALDMLREIHHAFYAENRDVTDEAVLADLAAARGIDRNDALRAFRDDATRQETRTDFAIAQKAGVRGFPCLIAGADGGEGYGVVTMGYQAAGPVLATVDRWLAGLGAALASDRSMGHPSPSEGSRP